MITFLSVAASVARLSGLDIGQGCTLRHHDGRVLVFSAAQKVRMRRLVASLPFTVVGDLDFVLLAAGTYWDFPFTVGTTTVVLTEKFFTFRNQPLVLAHEWVHLQQRLYPQIFADMYHRWGFRRAPATRLPSSYNLLRNPDGERYEWIWKSPVSGEEYLPFCHIKQDCGFEVLFAEVNSAGEVTGRMIPPTEEFAEAFPEATHQNYHPNEISAHLISQSLLRRKKAPTTGTGTSREKATTGGQ